MSDVATALQLQLSQGDSGPFARNKQYAKDAPDGYITKLSPEEQQQFNAWTQQSGVPYDPSPTADYDMPGFWKKLVSGQQLDMGVNDVDQRLHFTDEFKTPYYQSFSNESKYATPDAPRWIDAHRLADKSGRVLYDENTQLPR